MKPVFPEAPAWAGPDGGVCVSCPGGEAQADVIEAVARVMDALNALDVAMFLAQTPPLSSSPTHEGHEG